MVYDWWCQAKPLYCVIKSYEQFVQPEMHGSIRMRSHILSHSTMSYLLQTGQKIRPLDRPGREGLAARLYRPVTGQRAWEWQIILQSFNAPFQARQPSILNSMTLHQHKVWVSCSIANPASAFTSVMDTLHTCTTIP